MKLALEAAQKGARRGEIPVGAVVVSADGKLLGVGHNLRETTKDPSAHAEIVAIRRSTRRARDWQLTGATLYVTLEPCPMCVGAALEARMRRIVFGAASPLTGAAGTVLPLVDFPGLPRACEAQGGVLEVECSEILRRYFQEQRRPGEVAESG